MSLWGRPPGWFSSSSVRYILIQFGMYVSNVWFSLAHLVWFNYSLQAYKLVQVDAVRYILNTVLIRVLHSPPPLILGGGGITPLEKFMPPSPLG